MLGVPIHGVIVLLFEGGISSGKGEMWSCDYANNYTVHFE